VLIDCPGCAKSYHIGRQALGSSGRKVACPHCGSRWFVAADAQMTPDPQAAPDMVEPDFFSLDSQMQDIQMNEITAQEITAEATSGKPRQPTYEELYGTPRARKPDIPYPLQPHPLHVPFRLPPTVLGFTAIIGLAGMLLGLRDPIVRAWPQANAAYAPLGLAVNQRGLDLKNVQAKVIEDGGQSMLVVEGEIANRRAASTKVPNLRIGVRDASGQEVYSWDTAAPKTKLEAWETIAFRARLATPPSGGRDLFVRFAEAEQARAEPARK